MIPLLNVKLNGFDLQPLQPFTKVAVVCSAKRPGHNPQCRDPVDKHVPKKRRLKMATENGHSFSSTKINQFKDTQFSSIFRQSPT
jgi:hypothetical protein